MITAAASSDLLAMLPQQWLEFAQNTKLPEQIKIEEQLQAPALYLITSLRLPLTPIAERLSDLFRKGRTESEARLTCRAIGAFACFLRGSASAGIHAQPTRAKRHQLEQSTCNRDVLEEVDELVLVGEIVVERERRRNREQGHHPGNETGAVADYQGNAARHFDQHGEREAKRGKGKARTGDHPDGCGGGCQLGDAREQEQRRNENAAGQRDDGLQAGRNVRAVKRAGRYGS
jgi:hypothetical protein